MVRDVKPAGSGNDFGQAKGQGHENHGAQVLNEAGRHEETGNSAGEEEQVAKRYGLYLGANCQAWCLHR